MTGAGIAPVEMESLQHARGLRRLEDMDNNGTDLTGTAQLPLEDLNSLQSDAPHLVAGRSSLH